MTDKKLVDLLFKGKSAQDVADSIRKGKGITNDKDNVVVYQEKRSICETALKLSKLIKNIDKNAQVIIKTSKGKWQAD